MKPGQKNSYNSLKSINIGGKNYKYYSLSEAEKNGCTFYKRVPALGIEENFIKGLTELVLQQETRGNFVSSIMCPNRYVKCPCLGIRN